MKAQEARKYGMPDEVMLTRTEVSVSNVRKEHDLFLQKFPVGCRRPAARRVREIHRAAPIPNSGGCDDRAAVPDPRCP